MADSARVVGDECVFVRRVFTQSASCFYLGLFCLVFFLRTSDFPSFKLPPSHFLKGIQ